MIIAMLLMPTECTRTCDTYHLHIFNLDTKENNRGPKIEHCTALLGLIYIEAILRSKGGWNKVTRATLMWPNLKASIIYNYRDTNKPQWEGNVCVSAFLIRSEVV